LNIPQVNGTWADIYKDSIVSVSAAPVLHFVPCVSYVVTEAPVPGKIDLGQCPTSAMRQLQRGEDVVLADGTILHGPSRRKVVILGDTYDPSPITSLAEGADLLVHEATNAHLPGVDPNTQDSDTYYRIRTNQGHITRPFNTST
jgi:ribonuclease Z